MHAAAEDLADDEIALRDLQADAMDDAVGAGFTVRDVEASSALASTCAAPLFGLYKIGVE